MCRVQTSNTCLLAELNSGEDRSEPVAAGAGADAGAGAGDGGEGESEGASESANVGLTLSIRSSVSCQHNVRVLKFV